MNEDIDLVGRNYDVCVLVTRRWHGYRHGTLLHYIVQLQQSTTDMNMMGNITGCI